MPPVVKRLHKGHKAYTTLSRVTKEMASAGEESEDGGGRWDRYVTRGRKELLRKHPAPKVEILDDLPIESSKESHRHANKSKKLSKHLKAYKVSDDGGGGWHHYVTVRRHSGASNLSRSRHVSEFSSSSPSSDEDEIVRPTTLDLQEGQHQEVRLNFQQKRDRLHDILFGPRAFASCPPDDFEATTPSPIKGLAMLHFVK